jgi:UDP-N-acetylmuramyl pentapeptide phosphotransferase/UDP-N-acetylglucosamine-1-phosphate transferase
VLHYLDLGRPYNISFVTYRLNLECQFPQALAPWVPHYLELGPLYKLYMVALTVFATNAINILAGVNGLEVRLLQPLLLPCSSICMQLSGPTSI